MTRQQFFEYYRVGNRIYLWINQTCRSVSFNQLLSLPDMIVHVDGQQTDHSLRGDKVTKFEL